MKRFYYLSSCDTCKRILKELSLPSAVQLIDIKAQPLKASELDDMKALSGSFEALFSKRARLYKERNLREQTLEESDYRDLILEHYTFLKRPVLIWDGQIFIGNSKKTVAEALQTVKSA